MADQKWQDLSAGQQVGVVGAVGAAGAIGAVTLAITALVGYLAGGALAGGSQKRMDRGSMIGAVAAPVLLIASGAMASKLAPPMTDAERDRVMSKPPWQR